MLRPMLKYALVMVIASYSVSLSVLGPSFAQSPSDQVRVDELEKSFRQFLSEYWQEMKQRNSVYLRAVHPKLPGEAHEFFFDVTLDMMRYAEATEGVEPTIVCQDFSVCKVVYPQPNNSWAAQRFILHDGAWRWLDQ